MSQSKSQPLTRTILVTGGLGYAGGRVARTLADSGFSVRLGSRRALLAPPDWLPTASVATIDWASPDSLEAACDGVYGLVHLAGLNEAECAADPLAALEVNGGATAALLGAASKCGVRRFIYFSTAHVYGAPLSGRIDESTLPRPRHPYAISHRVAEDFVLSARDQLKLEGVALRLSNGFGAPMHCDIERWSLLVNDLCRQAVVEGKLVLKSAGLQKRDFISLGKVGRAVAHCLDADNSRLGDGLFNLGGNCVMSVADMAARVRDRWLSMTGVSLRIVRPDASVAEIDAASHSERLVYSCEKFEATGFDSSIELDIDYELDSTLAFCSRNKERLFEYA